MAILLLDSENAVRDLKTAAITVLTHTPHATNHVMCAAYLVLGDAGDPLDGTGGDFELTITVGGQTVEPNPQVVTFSTATRAAVWTAPFPVPAAQEVIVKVLSPNAADDTVRTTCYLFDMAPVAIDANGNASADLTYIHGTALTETAGQLAGAFIKFFDVAAPTLTCLGLNQTGDTYLLAKAGGAGDITAALTRVQLALPAIAPDAAGGLPTTTKITDARLGALTDLIDGGRLDLLIDSIVAGRGWIFGGTVTADVPGVSFTVGTMAGFGAGCFVDATSPWYAYVFRDNGGTGAPPQGEMRKITGYTTATGLFTTEAFSASVATNDQVFIVNPALADILSIKTSLAAALVTRVGGAVATYTLTGGTVQPITIAQYAHTDLSLVLSDEGGTPISLVGKTLRFKAMRGATIVFDFVSTDATEITIAGGTGGGFVIHFTAALTLVTERLSYELWDTTAVTGPILLAKADLDVVPTIGPT